MPLKQKTVIKVDEKGTEAAAVTAAVGLGDPQPFDGINKQWRSKL